MGWKKILKTALFILIFAVYWESISGEFWEYSAPLKKMMVFKAFPVLMIVFWMFIFTVSLFISENVYKKTSRVSSIPVFDIKLYVIDIIIFGITGITCEALLGRFGLLSYNQALHWTILPLINLPINSAAGYFGIGMFVPLTLRVFRGDGKE